MSEEIRFLNFKTHMLRVKHVTVIISTIKGNVNQTRDDSRINALCFGKIFTNYGILKKYDERRWTVSHPFYFDVSSATSGMLTSMPVSKKLEVRVGFQKLVFSLMRLRSKWFQRCFRFSFSYRPHLTENRKWSNVSIVQVTVMSTYQRK